MSEFRRRMMMRQAGETLPNSVAWTYSGTTYYKADEGTTYDQIIYPENLLFDYAYHTDPMQTANTTYGIALKLSFSELRETKLFVSVKRGKAVLCREKILITPTGNEYPFVCAMWETSGKSNDKIHFYKYAFEGDYSSSSYKPSTGYLFENSAVSGFTFTLGDTIVLEFDDNVSVIARYKETQYGHYTPSKGSGTQYKWYQRIPSPDILNVNNEATVY